VERAFVTGGAGFIGSNLVDRLLSKNISVTAFDNLSTGQTRFLDGARTSPKYRFIQEDLLNPDALARSMKGCDAVFHLAANADVRFGLEHPQKDLEQNTWATFNVLEAMRANGIRRIAFSSTGSIYGEPDIFPTPENAPFPIQTSLYGASKLACEGLIQAYCEGFGFEGYIFRFVSILGERYSHGHVFDFYQQLLSDSGQLKILGDGHQRKSYLYVQDCLDAILLAMEKAHGKVNLFNLGTAEYCQVNDSIGWITGELGLKPQLHYTGGIRGWIGDSPFILLDCRRIGDLGWTPKMSIKDSIIKTIQFLRQNPWLLETRS
jgi:UDP-glucose 4-epimerase